MKKGVDLTKLALLKEGQRVRITLDCMGKSEKVEGTIYKAPGKLGVALYLAHENPRFVGAGEKHPLHKVFSYYIGRTDKGICLDAVKPGTFVFLVDKKDKVTKKFLVDSVIPL